MTATTDINKLSTEELDALLDAAAQTKRQRLAAEAAQLDRRPLERLGRRRARRSARRAELLSTKSGIDHELAQLRDQEESDRPLIRTELQRWAAVGISPGEMAAALRLTGADKRRIYDLLRSAKGEP